MGTVFTVRVEEDMDPTCIEDVFEMWADVEERFSTFKPNSQISRLGRGELARDDADADVRQVLIECEEFEEASAGTFSIRPGRPGGPGIDPAGYVKGWSVDEAALMLFVAGLENFVIYAGGDVFCSGQPSDDDAWRIGIRHPGTSDALGAIVSMNRGGVATSGIYERGDHIWGSRVSDGSVLGVSVVGPSLGVADALATAIFADQATSLDWLDAYPDYGIIVFDAAGGVRWSANIDNRIEIPGRVLT
jgi:thiamine biosynthesis lipoprotein